MTPDPAADALFEYHGGLHLKDSVLWFDAPTPRNLCFIGHANIAGSFDHQKILATERTAELLKAGAAAHGRGRRAHEPQALVSPYARPFSLGQLSLELFPSGHVLGAASLLVEHKGLELVYAGNVNPRTSLLIERIEARPCELLVLPCHFGQRRYVFPPFEQVSEDLVRFVRDGLQRKETPVLFCSPLGEAQEVAHLLLEAGLRCRVHRQIFAACRVYQQAGAPLGNVRCYSGKLDADEALIWPANLHASASLKKLPATRTALASGQALDDEARRRLGCDAAFCISCHADYAGLLEYVRACDPKRVILTQGASNELAEDLRALGMEVSSIGPPEQMGLF